MILLFDIGNTHTHLGLAGDAGILRQRNISTRAWSSGQAGSLVDAFCRGAHVRGAAVCSVVPTVTPWVRQWVSSRFGCEVAELNSRTLKGLGIDYPKPRTIGPDRLANSLAAAKHYGAPVIVVDFGTAVTFDVVDQRSHYVGGIIAPGLSAMTDYLHEKTALLPRIEIREPRRVVGKSTREAMLAGAVLGYRGLIKELVLELKKELQCKRLRVIATGGYARLIAQRLPLIEAVDDNLTLEGLRLHWEQIMSQKPARR